jgi:hypothetical protein
VEQWFNNSLTIVEQWFNNSSTIVQQPFNHRSTTVQPSFIIFIGVLSVAINGTLTARQGIKSNFHIVQTRLIGVLSVAKKSALGA